MIPPAHRFEPSARTIADANIEQWMQAETDEFQQLTKRIRASYFLIYNYFNNEADSQYGAQPIPQWDGGQSKGKIFRPIWTKIAQQLLRHGITNVERFIYSQFASRPNKKIFPTHLLTQRALDYYSEFDKFADAELEMRLRADMCRFKEQFQQLGRENLDRILLDPNNDISPLFRYIVAKTESRSAILPKLKTLAKIQFGLDPVGYSRVWGRFVPSELFGDLS